MGDNAFYDYQNQSQFNQGLAQVFRMDAWTKGSAQAIITGDHEQRYKMLLCYFNECWGTDTLRKPKKSELITRKERHHQKQQKISRLMREYQRLKGKSAKIKLENHPEHFLQEWEMELRDWAQTLGLGMKKSSDGTWAAME